MSDYQAYLIRLQRHPERVNWRISLENIHTREVQHFVSVEEAFSYLKRCATAVPDWLEDSRPDFHSDSV